MPIPLHAEYLQRHDLSVNPILHRSSPTAFLRSQYTPLSWRVLSVKWSNACYQPGLHTVTLYEVLPNGVSMADAGKGVDRKYLVEHDGPYSWESQEYEACLLEMIDEIKKDGFRSPCIHEVELSAWCIFSTMHERWLTRVFGCRFTSLFKKMSRDNLPIAERLEACEELKDRCCCWIPTEVAWKRRVLPLLKNHSEWLAKLVND